MDLAEFIQKVQEIWKKIEEESDAPENAMMFLKSLKSLCAHTLEGSGISDELEQEVKKNLFKVEEKISELKSQINLKPKTMRYEELTLHSAYRAILNVESISQAESEGFFNVAPDPSGAMRKVPLVMKLDDVPYPSLALEVLRVGTRNNEILLHGSRQINNPRRGLLGITLGQWFIPTDDSGQLTLNYRGPERTFPYVSAVDILDGKQIKRLQGKFVLIGTSAAGLFDLCTTPFSNLYPGVEVHATVIDNILASDPLTHDIYTEIGLTYTLVVVGGLALSALLAFMSPLAGGLGEKKLKVATQKDAEDVTGLQVGGISPLALINRGFQICLDRSAQEHPFIHISGGQRGLNVRLPVNDFVKLTQARLMDIARAT